MTDDLLSGLAGMGLGDLTSMDIFEKPKTVDLSAPQKATTIEEKDIVFEKKYTCVVCDHEFTSKAVMGGKSKLTKTDLDLRSVYDNVDMTKYNVVVCPYCGYASIVKLHKPMSPGMTKMIKENISKTFHWEVEEGPVMPYPNAFKRYQLALVNAVVRKGKNSEKAYICLQTAWLLRGWAESLAKSDKPEDQALKPQVEAQEKSYLLKAYEGYAATLETETPPFVAMDGTTAEYLLAVLAYEVKKYDIASKTVARLLTNPTTPPRMKDKCRDLKDMLLEELKK